MLGRFLLCCAALAPFGFCSSSAARAQSYEVEAEPEPHDILMASNVGMRFLIAPGIYFPSHGPAGLSIAAEGRYGFALGDFVLAPGLRPEAYFGDGNVFLGLGTLRATYVVGRFAPFIMGGTGPGFVSTGSQTGLAYMGGGGFMILAGTRFGLGAEASYQGITDTGFAALFVGPSFFFLY